MMESASEGSSPRIWVLDSSAIIEVKDFYSVNPVGAVRAFEVLQDLLLSGQIAIHEFVRDELNQWIGPGDLPGEWVRENYAKQRVPKSRYEGIRQVVSVFPQAIGKQFRVQVADPWIVGYAIELYESGHPVTVVTEDRADKTEHVSIRTMCRHFSIGCLETGWFLRDCNAPEP